jgi:replicative DNA helicase
LIAFTSRLEANGKLQGVGGPGTLTEILITLPGPDPHQARYYFDLLVQAHIARETLKVANESLKDLERMQLEPLAFAEQIASAAQGPEVKKHKTLSEQLDELCAELERKEPREAFPAGPIGLDMALDGGIHRGELVIAGGTSAGKSILLAQAALASARNGKATAFFSCEMPTTDILKRMAANHSDYPMRKNGEKISEKEFQALSETIRFLHDLPLTIRDDIFSLSAIEAEARRLIRLKKADVVVVDYLQLVENAAAETREGCVSEIARKFKNLSLSGNCAVLTASQLNDEGKLRESRAIGHHADIVVEIRDEAMLIIKNRRGRRDVSVQVNLRAELGRFEQG